jgi:hypothetical protein
MRARRFALLSIFAVIPILESGCIGVATDGIWPAGTEAIISARTSRVPADVAIGQRNEVGGRRRVPLANGTRVVCLDPLHDVFVSSNPYRADPSILAAPVRVKPRTGAYSQIELIVRRGELEIAPVPVSKSFRAVVLAIIVCGCVSATMAFVGRCSDELRRRRDLVRHAPRGAFCRTTSIISDEPQVPLHRPEQDQAKWLAWIADRNARTKNRGGSSGALMTFDQPPPNQYWRLG